MPKGNTAAKRRLMIILASAVALLATMHIITLVLKTHGDLWQRLAPSFDLDNEFNIPSAYNAFLWAQCALLVVLLAVRSSTSGDRWRFGLLAGFFLYLGFDELLIWHEGFAKPIREGLSISGGNVLYHAWVIPAIAVLVCLGVIYAGLRLAKGISPLQRNLVLYIIVVAAGVIGLEMLGTQLYFSNVVYKLGPVLVEEVFEIGAASFILYKLSAELL